MAGFLPGFGRGGIIHSLVVKEPVSPGLGDMLVLISGLGCMAGARAGASMPVDAAGEMAAADMLGLLFGLRPIGGLVGGGLTAFGVTSEIWAAFSEARVRYCVQRAQR